MIVVNIIYNQKTLLLWLQDKIPALEDQILPPAEETQEAETRKKISTWKKSSNRLTKTVMKTVMRMHRLTKIMTMTTKTVIRNFMMTMTTTMTRTTTIMMMKRMSMMMRTEEETTVTKDGTVRADSALQVHEEVLRGAAQEAILREVQEVVHPEEETRAVLQDLQAQAADLQEEAGEILPEGHKADLQEEVLQ